MTRSALYPALCVAGGLALALVSGPGCGGRASIDGGAAAGAGGATSRGGTDSGGSSAGGSGGLIGGRSGSGGGPGGSGGQPGVGGGGAGCIGCLLANCPQAISCFNNPACLQGTQCAIEQCLSSGSPDFGCILQCFDGNPGAALEALQVFACAASNCPDDCAGGITP